MVSFRVSTDVRAPPGFVVDWWWNYSPDDSPLAPGMTGREVERVDERTIRVASRVEFGGRIRTTNGTVTRTGPASWQLSAHVSSGGKVVSTLQTSYVVEPAVDGSRVLADFQFVGRTLSWRLVLFLSQSRLRRDRIQSLETFARAIETEFAASPSGPAAGVSGTARREEPVPPA